MFSNEMKFALETIDIEETRIEQFYEYLHLITMVFYHICVCEFHIAFVRMMASKCLQY